MTTHFIASFIVLCLSGLLISSYLIWQHRQKKPLVCPLDHDCSTVTESKWSNIFYVRNEVLGLLFYVLMLAGIIIIISRVAPQFSSLVGLLMIVASRAAVLFSLFLVFVQFRIIKDYCFYCLLSGIINVLLLLNILAL